eukprot:PhF_6_TR20619/c0_g1_i1/m.29712
MPPRKRDLYDRDESSEDDAMPRNTVLSIPQNGRPLTLAEAFFAKVREEAQEILKNQECLSPSRLRVSTQHAFNTSTQDDERIESPPPAEPISTEFVAYALQCFRSIQSKIEFVRKRTTSLTPLPEDWKNTKPTLKVLASLDTNSIESILEKSCEESDLGWWPYLAMCALEEPLLRETEALLFEYGQVVLKTPPGPNRTLMLVILGHKYGQVPR